MRTEIPVANGFYVSDSLPISHQECTNWIPIIPQAPALSQRQLYGTPGIRQIADSGGGTDDINRGAWDLGGTPYFVQGATLYKLDRTFPDGVETFSLSAEGSLDAGSRVSMADNGTQLMILIPGGKGYIYTEGGGLVEITDADFRANGDPQYVVFIDGYFACSTDSKKWIISALNDGTSWDALDFGTAESDPDPIVAPVVHNNQIFLTGSETTEGNQNIGGAGFPFQRSNVFLDKGCYAPFSLINSNQRFFMIGGGKNERAGIWVYGGGQFQKISTNAIDNVLNDYSDAVLNAAFALNWGFRGQFYVAFTFTDRTFVFNQTTNLWHEQKSSIPDADTGDPEQDRWRVNSMVTAYGYTLVGDNQDGRIGILDIDEYQEYDQNIIRLFTTQPIANQGRSYRIPMIELTMESGVGNGVEDPQVSLAISEDAKTFDYERNRNVGKIGRYKDRIVWRKNGRVPRYSCWRFRLSDPVKPVVIKLEADLI